MKKLISLLLTMAMMLSMFSFISVFAAETVVFEEGFENGLENWTKKKGNEDEKQYLANEKAKDGKNSLCVTDDTDAGAFGFQSINIPATPGVTYTVSGDLFSEGTASNKIFFTYIDAEGTRLFNQSFGAKAVGAWENVSLTQLAPAGTVAIVLHLTGSKVGIGTTYYDNIKITTDGKAGEATAPTIVPSTTTTNPAVGGEVVFADSFENGTDNWKFNGVKASEENSKFVTDKASDGKVAAYVVDDSEEAAFGFVSKKLPATAGATYTITGDTYNVEGVGAKLFIGFFGSDDKRIVSKSVGKSTVGEWVSISLTEVAPEGTVSMLVYITGSAKTVGTSYVDNVKVVCESAAAPKEESKMDSLNKSSIALFVGSANALVNGEKTLIDKTNDKVIATIVDSRTLVPVRFIAENFGAEVGWDDATRTVTLTLKDKTVKIVLDKAEIDINGQVTTIDVPAQSIEGRTMLPLRAFVENVMGKKIFWDARGLIVITDLDMLDANADKAIIDELVETIK